MRWRNDPASHRDAHLRIAIPPPTRHRPLAAPIRSHPSATTFHNHPIYIIDNTKQVLTSFFRLRAFGWRMWLRNFTFAGFWMADVVAALRVRRRMMDAFVRFLTTLVH